MLKNLTHYDITGGLNDDVISHYITWTDELGVKLTATIHDEENIEITVSDTVTLSLDDMTTIRDACVRHLWKDRSW